MALQQVRSLRTTRCPVSRKCRSPTKCDKVESRPPCRESLRPNAYEIPISTLLASPRTFMRRQPSCWERIRWTHAPLPVAAALRACRCLRSAMSWVKMMFWKTNRHVDHDTEGNGPPFPSTSTFFGIAAAMLALWLLASGLGQLFSPSGQSDSANAIHSDIVPGPRR